MKFILFILFCVALFAHERVLYNATIYTMEPSQTWAQAIVLKNDKIIYVGSNQKALQIASKSAILENQHGKFILPGFIDSHTHIALGSLLANQGINLIQTRGKKAILDAIKNYALSHPKQSVITGVGFYPYVFGPNGPSAKELDQVISDRPAFIIANNGHSAWCNTKALHLLSIDHTIQDKEEHYYRYIKDKEGQPSGFMIEAEAIWPHFKTLGLGTAEKFSNALDPFLPKLSALGITSVYDAGAFSVEEESYKALCDLDKRHKLPVRYYASTMITDSTSSSNAIQRYESYKLTYKTPHFSINSLKIINDNSDDDSPDILFDEQRLSTILKPLLSSNYSIMVHTSTAQSVSTALNALEKLPKSQSRITLAHLNMVHDDDFSRLKKLGVIANIQPFSADGEGYYTYRYMLYGEEWENKLVRFNTFFNYAIPVSGSSDYPACNQEIEFCSPMHGIESALTRQKIGSASNATILPSANERVSLHEALYMYTMGGAYQLGLEKEIGSLRHGKKADLVILEGNPFKSDLKQLHTLRVHETIMDGNSVFKR